MQWCRPCPYWWSWCRLWGLTGEWEGWGREYGRGEVGECALQREREGEGGGGGSGVVDVEEVPRTEINCRKYLSSMEECAHVLSAPFFPSHGMMSQRL